MSFLISSDVLNIPENIIQKYETFMTFKHFAKKYNYLPISTKDIQLSFDPNKFRLDEVLKRLKSEFNSFETENNFGEMISYCNILDFKSAALIALHKINESDNNLYEGFELTIEKTYKEQDWYTLLFNRNNKKELHRIELNLLICNTVIVKPVD